MKKSYTALATMLLVASSSVVSFANSNPEQVDKQEVKTENVEVVTPRTTTAIINANNVKLRATPSTSGTVVKTLSKGTMVHHTGTIRYANGYYWYSVTHGGKNGWVAGNYLSFK
ncbi:SH3 domain-containing protein [Salmonella enterica subsp. enterica serovar Infantis]|uniref:SH3 domain-containing protein n=1 Tax=Paraclostridium bifermentans TaxID=1490 RepID=A0A5P3XK73_PARBF|nr:SH3 domain-containing protein [Paraclostridium bifermentans]MCU9810201.1 SH3 domain-containing protein [Paraclostridium sp. AKS46]QEZ70778.1 SH3 domain-containing protein [Paraclostridium bifermentans]